MNPLEPFPLIKITSVTEISVPATRMATNRFYYLYIMTLLCDCVLSYRKSGEVNLSASLKSPLFNWQG